MAKINEIKEQKTVVKSVGDFANSLQQISASRMAALRKTVLKSRRFVDETTAILRELRIEQRRARQQELQKVIRNYKMSTNKHAIIVITSNQGLCGSYNSEIFKKLDVIVPQNKEADYFVLGTKGQEYFRRLVRKYGVKFYPYNIPEFLEIKHLQSLIRMFPRYDKINLVYSKYINPIVREIIFEELTVPENATEQSADLNAKTKFIFEPAIETLIDNVSGKLRYALFRQQILESKLALYASQMIAMQTATDNAKDLLKDLQLQYNKERRKLIDKKIQEVQAGRALWADAD